jgi:CYTH domain-containing protein
MQATAVSDAGYDRSVARDELEIERRFRLRAAPAPETLEQHGAEVYRFEQLYLVAPPPGRRVRRIERPDGTVEHRFTHKSRARGLVREELERPITEAEYDDLRTEADPARRPIRKTRYVIAHGDRLLEIDVFDEPMGLVLVEVELESEHEAVTLPGWLGEHRDVSTNPAYQNAHLARRDAKLPRY